jgi:phosphatidylethanolamine-binding protein (PEBP) family uncharacterized protein
MRRRELLTAVAASATAGAGCTIGGEPPEPDALALSAPAFEDGGIPERYTCDGAAVSPPLRVEGVPEGTESLAVVGEWLQGYSPGTFWLLWGLPPTDPLEISEDLPPEARLEAPEGARQGTNDEGFVGYRSPCHRAPGENEYRVSLLALATSPEVEAGAARDAFDDAVETEIRSSTSLIAVYERF